MPPMGYEVVRSSFHNTQTWVQHAQFTIYTDGSKMGNRVGAGFVSYHQGRSCHEAAYRLPEFATVFQAEILAIREACAWLETCPNAHFVKICVDSMAALQALSSDHISSSLVRDTVRILNRVAKDRVIRLVWVKAHSGIRGN